MNKFILLLLLLHVSLIESASESIKIDYFSDDAHKNKIQEVNRLQQEALRISWESDEAYRRKDCNCVSVYVHPTMNCSLDNGRNLLERLGHEVIGNSFVSQKDCWNDDNKKRINKLLANLKVINDALIAGNRSLEELSQQKMMTQKLVDDYIANINLEIIQQDCLDNGNKTHK